MIILNENVPFHFTKLPLTACFKVNMDSEKNIIISLSNSHSTAVIAFESLPNVAEDVIII